MAAPVRRACIDIGSNTTRLLVADNVAGELRHVENQRVFTYVRRGLRADGTLAPPAIESLCAIVEELLDRARALGAELVVAVATAAVRRALNRDALIAELRDRCGLELRVLSEDDEARLAFIGACQALGRIGPDPGSGRADGDPADVAVRVAVVDVGGGSSELVVGRRPDRVDWWTSLPLGSGELADTFLSADPPSAAELSRAQDHVAEVMGATDPPRPARALAVGGSAASLLPLAGTRLDADAFVTALRTLLAGTAGEVAGRFGLSEERVRLLPAGLLILQAVQDRLGVPLELVGGGVREGVLLEL